MKRRTLNDRRRLVTLAISALGLSWVACSARADANFLGVAAGDASSNEAVVWTRATNTVAASPVALIAQVAPDDPTLTIGVTTFNVSTDPSRDYTAKLVLSNLLSGTRYYYRFVNASNPANTSIVGTFKTAPDASAAVGVRFAFSGDADGMMRPYALASIFPSLSLDFFVFDGNTIYESASAFSAAATLTGTIPAPSSSGATQTQLFTDYFRKNREQFIAVNSGGQKCLQPMFAAQGNYTLLNNHELGDRQYINGGAPAGGPVGGMPSGAGVDARLAVNDANLGATFMNKALGFQTLQQIFLNYQPVKERGFIDTGADPRTDDTPLLFFAQQWGQNAIVLNADDRTYRDIRMKTAANADDTGSRAANPERTMLGDTQLEWLKQSLLDAENARIPWKFVVVSDPIDQIGPIGGALNGTTNGGNAGYSTVKSDDGKSWIGGYRAERNDLLKYIADQHIHNVIFLTTGDHQSRVNELTYSPVGDTESQSSYVPVPTSFAIVSGPLGASGPDLVTNHTFANNKLIADSIANAQIAAGIDPIGLSPTYPGLHNVTREGDALADGVRQPTDFYSPDTFNISVLEISPDGKTLTVTAVGMNSYGQNVRPEYNPTNNPARSIFSFQVDSGVAPVFTSCPGDITVTNDIGQSSALVNFTVAATGVPDPVVTCTLGGVPITSPFRFPIGASTVACTASNSMGAATCSFNVTVLAGPEFTSCPGDITVTNDIGQTSALVNFNVAATGLPTPVVTCMLGGVPITSPFRFPIGVSTVMCTASNSVGTATCSFNVTVLAGPEFTSYPGDITVTNDAGQTSALVNFNVAATGLPTPVVTCMLGGVPITSPFRFPIGVSTVTCTASNSVGTATCSFNVTVLAGPEFTSCPGDITVTNDIGQSSALVNFTVAATGLPSPVVTCMLGDVPITSPFSFPIGVSTVTCTASNSVGTATCSFNVMVLAGPEFTSCPGNITVTNDAGQTSALVDFNVAATGLPTPVVTCMLGGVPITSPFRFPIGVSTVACTASNSVGTATCSFNVTVLAGPEFTACPGNITVTNDAGQSSALVSFSVAAMGLPKPVVTCMLGGVPITSPFRFPIGVSTVTCTASNSVGTATCSFNVTVLAGPEFTSTSGNVTVTNDVGQSSALVNFTVTASGMPTPVVTCMLGGVPITSPFSFPIGVSTVTCTASNSVGTATISFDVTVLAAPQFTSCPGDITVLNDADQSSALVSFTVAAFGLPAPVVTCMLGDVPITSPYRFPTGISTVTCTASNSLGTATCSFIVTVLESGDAPVFTSFPDDITVGNDAGQCSALVSFTVAATGVPAPVVTCMLGDVPITSPFTFPKGVSKVICTASNSLGTATRCFKVTVQDREAPTVTLQPADKNDTFELLSQDNCDPNPQIFVLDTASSFVAGPFANGDVVKITVNPHGTPKLKIAGGSVTITLNGDPMVVAMDADGNCSGGEPMKSYLKFRSARGRGPAGFHGRGKGPVKSNGRGIGVQILKSSLN